MSFMGGAKAGTRIPPARRREGSIPARSATRSKQRQRGRRPSCSKRLLEETRFIHADSRLKTGSSGFFSPWVMMVHSSQEVRKATWKSVRSGLRFALVFWAASRSPVRKRPPRRRRTSRFLCMRVWARPTSPSRRARELAQKYFDQGLRLHFGFWISESRRSFEEAAV